MGLTETNAVQVNQFEDAGRGRDHVSRANRGVRFDSLQEQALKRQKEFHMLLVKKPIHVIVRVRSQEHSGERHSDNDNDERAEKLPHVPFCIGLPHVPYCIGWIPLFVNNDYGVLLAVHTILIELLQFE